MINQHLKVALVGSLLCLLPSTSVYAVEYIDTADCAVDADAGGGSRDIRSVNATYNEVDQSVSVALELCGSPSGKTKYRVQYDVVSPFATDADRNGDGVIDATDECVNTADTRQMLRVNKAKQWGPGIVEFSSDPNTLDYSLLLSDLGAGVEEGDTIFIWTSTLLKGIADQAPNTDASDGCLNPETIDEVIVLELTSDGGGNPDPCLCEGLSEGTVDWNDSFTATSCQNQFSGTILLNIVLSDATGNTISLDPANLLSDDPPTCKVRDAGTLGLNTMILADMPQIDACVASLQTIASNDGINCQ